MTFEVEQIPDELLMRAAKEMGSRSNEARILQEIRSGRSKDRQMFAFRCGSVWFIGSTPDARTKLDMIEMAQDLAAED
jgi:hypothetical protein